MKYSLACLAIAAALTGCASLSANLTTRLREAAAAAIGGNTAPASIAVSGVQRGTTYVRWSARAPTGTFVCSADELVRRPYCVKQ